MEFLKLCWLRLTVSYYELQEYLAVIFKYYSHKSFRQQDLSLLVKYLWVSPFKISKDYLTSQGALDPYLYGETPLTTLEKICKECNIQKSDVFYELGCGRARTCFWLANFIGCQVVGIEQIKQFVEKANQVKAACRVEKVKILQADYFDIDLTKASVVYLYGTCLDEPSIQLLIKKFCTLPSQAKLITVSFPLTDYLDSSQHDLFEVVHNFEGSFPWGKAFLYLHVRQ